MAIEYRLRRETGPYSVARRYFETKPSNKAVARRPPSRGRGLGRLVQVCSGEEARIERHVPRDHNGQRQDKMREKNNYIRAQNKTYALYLIILNRSYILSYQINGGPLPHKEPLQH